VVVGVGVVVVVVAAPLVALAVRAPWSELDAFVQDRAVREALALSLVTATIAAAVATVLGSLVGHFLAHHRGRAGTVVRALVTLPLVLPPVAAGVALLFAFGRRGVFGDILGALGLDLSFTVGAVIVAQTFVSLPFVVLTTEAGFRALDRAHVETAATLGATPWQRLWRIDLPLARAAVGSGAVLAWARSVGELGATLTFAGIVPGVTETAPLRILGALESDPESALLLSMVLVVLSAVVLVALRGRWVPALRRAPVRADA
jgi:molybdate transport system permease protein